MRTILHLRASSGLAGPERWLLETAPALGVEGFRTAAALLERRPGATDGILAEARDRGLEASAVADRSRIGGGTVASVVGEMRRTEAVALHAHDIRSNWMALAAARRSARPAFATVHLHTRGSLPLRLYRWVDLARLHRFARVFAVSESVAREIARWVPRDRLRVVRNGVDAGRLDERARREVGAARALFAAGGQGPWLVAAGRLARQKGLDRMIRALALGGGALDRARLGLIGGGPEQTTLGRLAERAGVAERLLWLGERREVAGFLAAADVVVLPSRREGLPFVALEALALGRPLVAMAVGGVPELVSSEREGWLVRGGAAALAAALREALDDPDEAARRGDAGRERVVRELSAAATACATAAAYREVLGREAAE